MVPGELGKHAVSLAEDSAEKRLLAVDEQGYCVYPAAVVVVGVDGKLHLRFDHDFGEAFVELTHVQPRVRMPWHPKFLKGVYTIMLRRNLGRGRVLEGLELRWGLVSNILHAWTALGHWRLDGSVGPMHKWYDPRLFDLLSHTDIMAQRAVSLDGTALPEARTGAELASAGLDVRFSEPPTMPALPMRLRLAQVLRRKAATRTSTSRRTCSGAGSNVQSSASAATSRVGGCSSGPAASQAPRIRSGRRTRRRQLRTCTRSCAGCAAGSWPRALWWTSS